MWVLTPSEVRKVLALTAVVPAPEPGVGLGVGVAVGLAVGDAVGLAVGDGVGLGVAVGAAEGDGVGLGDKFGMAEVEAGVGDWAIVIGAKPWQPARSHRPIALEANWMLNLVRPILRFIARPHVFATIQCKLRS
jgi:hypothetical protein